MDDEGYIRLWRRSFHHEFWQENRQFSRFEAWLDMIQMAAYWDHPVWVRGKRIELKRGEFVGSERFLGERWKWSRSKVRRFFDVLKSDHMADQREDRGETIINLCNYETYNGCSDENGPAKEPVKEPEKDQRRTSDEPKPKKGNKGKNIEVDKSTSYARTNISWSRERYDRKLGQVFLGVQTGWAGITDELIDEWRATYPSVNIERKLIELNRWALDNPRKAGGRKQWGKTVDFALRKQHDRGGDRDVASKPLANSRQADLFAEPVDWQKDFLKACQRLARGDPQLEADLVMTGDQPWHKLKKSIQDEIAKIRKERGQ